MAEITFPEALPGHWNSSDGQDMARRYATMTRRELCGGDMTDMEAAYHVAMTMRNALNHEGRLTVARDRIRWLSVQLHLALVALKPFAGVVPEFEKIAAEECDEGEGLEDDDTVCLSHPLRSLPEEGELTYGDFRRAAALCTALTGMRRRQPEDPS